MDRGSAGVVGLPVSDASRHSDVDGRYYYDHHGSHGCGWLVGLDGVVDGQGDA